MQQRQGSWLSGIFLFVLLGSACAPGQIAGQGAAPSLSNKERPAWIDGGSIYFRCNATSWALNAQSRLTPTSDPDILSLKYEVREPWMPSAGDSCSVVETPVVDAWGDWQHFFSVSLPSGPLRAGQRASLEPAVPSSSFGVLYPGLGSFRVSLSRSRGTIQVDEVFEHPDTGTLSPVLREGQFARADRGLSFLYPNINSCLTITVKLDTGPKLGAHCVLFPESWQLSINDVLAKMKQYIQENHLENAVDEVIFAGDTLTWSDNLDIVTNSQGNSLLKIGQDLGGRNITAVDVNMYTEDGKKSVTIEVDDSPVLRIVKPDGEVVTLRGAPLQLDDAPGSTNAVKILLSPRGRCSGFVAADGLVITAAHCFDGGYTPIKIVFKNGAERTEGLRFGDYRKDAAGTFDEDIAWVTFEGGLPENATICKVLRDPHIAIPSGSPVVHFGYGVDHPEGESTRLTTIAFDALASPATVKEMTMAINGLLDDQVVPFIQSTILYVKGGTLKEANSGGPLYYRHQGEWTCAGVLGGDAPEGATHMFTAISRFADWIQTTSGKPVTLRD